MAEDAYVLLKKFPTQGTNIFPIANSKLGGQLLTEFNIKSRESVATDSKVEYTIGPSFVHSYKDYLVSSVAGSDTRLEIAPGRGVIDGHFVELLTPLEIDMTEVNAGRDKPLSGDLAIGLKVMYSTESTIAGTIEVENPVDDNTSYDGVYRGIQVVIGPATGSTKLNTPSDVPTDKSKVTAHLILATFNYNSGNGFIDPDTINNNPDKIRSVDASRLFNLEQELGDRYVTNPKDGDSSGLYGFASRRKSDSDATPVFGLERLDNCLFEWRNMNTDLVEEGLLDKDPSETDRSRGKAGAEFVKDPTGFYLKVPAKQGYVLVNGQRKYRSDLKVPLPEADYASSSYGVVGPTYTKNIKSINSKLNSIYSSIRGKQRAYVDVLTDRKDLPPVTNKFQVGDYVIVREDQTPTNVPSFEGTGYPSTLYAIIPGIVNRCMLLRYEDALSPVMPEDICDMIDGVCLSVIHINESEAPFVISEGKLYDKKKDGTVEESTDDDIVRYLGLSDTVYRGIKLKPDYAEDPNTQEALDNLRQSFNSLIIIQDSYLAAQSELHNMNESLVSLQLDYTRAVNKYNAAKALYDEYKAIYESKPEHTPEETAKLDRLFDNQLDAAVTKERLESQVQDLMSQIESKTADLSNKKNAYAEVVKDYKNKLSIYLGTLNSFDYFLYSIDHVDDKGKEAGSELFIFAVKETEAYEYSEPLWLSGPTYPATEDTVGGFQDVDHSVVGKGYVHIDDENHLVLNDFSILMGDILALQLAKGFSVPSGLDPKVIQQELDNYGNNRVAFPNYEILNQIVASSKLEEYAGIPSYKIEIHLSLPQVEEGENATINLHNIDSRFGTYIHLYIEGDAKSNTTLNISDCQKIRIDSNISGTPTINLNNSCLYYDYSVMNRLNRIYGLSLWYERFSADDPRIHVDGMTVCSDVKVRSDSDVNVGRQYDEDTDAFSTKDLYYGYNIESITFSSYGEIIGAGINIVNATTVDIVDNKDIVEGFLYKEFVLPQNNTDLQYPITKFKNIIKIDGAFTTIYRVANTVKYMCMDTIFSAVMNEVNVNKETAAGRIGIHYICKYVNYSGPDTLAYTQRSDDEIFASIHGSGTEFSSSDLTTLNSPVSTRTYHTFRGISGNNIAGA